MEFAVLITVSIISLSSGHNSLVIVIHDVPYSVHTASATDHLIKACSPSLFPTIT
jgi:hypothetical protein